MSYRFVSRQEGKPYGKVNLELHSTNIHIHCNLGLTKLKRENSHFKCRQTRRNENQHFQSENLYLLLKVFWNLSLGGSELSHTLCRLGETTEINQSRVFAEPGYLFMKQVYDRALFSSNGTKILAKVIYRGKRVRPEGVSLLGKHRCLVIELLSSLRDLSLEIDGT